jgi:hypothetical protein
MTNSFTRPLGWIDLLSFFVFGVAFLVLAGSGHREAAAAMIVTSLFEGLFASLRRHQARRQAAARGQNMAGGASGNGGLTTLPIKEAVMLRHSPEVVWSLIRLAETTPLLDPNCQKGYRVPGTPSGVGEQQAFVDLQGRTSVIEVIDCVEFSRAVTRLIAPDSPVEVVSTTSIEPVAGGCILALTHQFGLPAGSAYTADQIADIRRGLRDYLERVRAALETWEAPTGTPGG